MKPEEIALIKRAQNGDDAAFTILVEMHDSRVMSLANSILGPGFDAEEVYQEIFLKVHKAIKSFRFESSFTTWLHRVAVNLAISRKRSLTRRKSKETVMQTENDYFDNVPGNPHETPERLHLREEILQQIEMALARLPDRQRTVFVMKHDQGMKLKEIAKHLGLAEGSVKAYLFRAIENLRKILAPYYNADL
ncbi:RNA polymerase sigma factor [bacterium]|nr:RNA polymerase sigma factor [bacterium]